jgi:hypothetical protein
LPPLFIPGRLSQCCKWHPVVGRFEMVRARSGAPLDKALGFSITL